jgi:uncharacterized glyoxalase superfamily protein PhnB
MALKQNRSMPHSNVMPTLVYESVPKAVDWLSKTFGFRELWRIEEHGAMLELEGGHVYVREPRGPRTEFMRTAASTCTSSLLVRIESVERHYERTVREGANILQEPKNEIYGEKQYAVEDFAGHHWTFSETIEDIPPERWGARLAHAQGAR